MPKLNIQRRTLLTGASIAAAAMTLSLAGTPSSTAVQAHTGTRADIAATRVRHRTLTINGTDVFFREAGRSDAPAILLLHGFPTSSHMYRNLIPALADRYRVIAPDYPGFGNSAMPDRSSYDYTFANCASTVAALTDALGLERFALYVMDYGAPVGFRLATQHPERVSALIVQNGNAYSEGIGEFWDPIRKYWASGAAADREAIRWLTSIEATKWQYTDGVPDPSLVSPDTWTVDQAFLDRPGNQEIQLDLFYDYRTNIPLYGEWQAYLREHRPPALVLWGENDQIFLADGAHPYMRDLPDAEQHMFDTGHFALETHGAEIATLIRDFLGRRLPAGTTRS